MIISDEGETYPVALIVGGGATFAAQCHDANAAISRLLSAAFTA
jgi:hypothetical protein